MLASATPSSLAIDPVSFEEIRERTSCNLAVSSDTISAPRLSAALAASAACLAAFASSYRFCKHEECVGSVPCNVLIQNLPKWGATHLAISITVTNYMSSGAWISIPELSRQVEHYIDD